MPVRAGRAKQSAIWVHRSGRLAAEETVVRDHIPVTTVARTLLDLADVLPAQALKRAIDEAEYRGRFDLTSLKAVVESNPGRRGARVLALAREPAQRTRSDLEDDFLAFCRRHRIPRPAVGIEFAGYEVASAWPEARLIVETDCRAAHRNRRALEDDRTRDRRTLRAGHETIRLTDRALGRRGMRSPTTSASSSLKPAPAPPAAPRGARAPPDSRPGGPAARRPAPGSRRPGRARSRGWRRRARPTPRSARFA